MSSTTFRTFDQLLGGSAEEMVTETRLPLKAPGTNTTYARGTILAVNETGGADLVPYDSATATRDAFYAVLAEDVTFVSTDTVAKPCVVYLSGQFNDAAVIFLATGSVATIRDDARLKDCYFVPCKNNNATTYYPAT